MQVLSKLKSILKSHRISSGQGNALPLRRPLLICLVE